ncbi:pyridoxamine 5'-phosphate oxidase family protein [Methylomicrobium sp. Wu6]|uniref:globin domain-containing protein n=1 Tax=Methylomicrobium sp. Wu6 TaxID=3107928 RepID=UPI002DD655DF|nr:pyridoxamine 5'-phosphate oxidase family protein [Methylomicrobium sp. Wu6]MEC4748033.1 pyridoxamine 5'-phosphate oxidase family protein [Methylomicrobium sp. Wu6]
MGRFSFKKKSSKQSGKESAQQKEAPAIQQAKKPAEARDEHRASAETTKKFAFLRDRSKTEASAALGTVQPDLVTNMNAEADWHINQKKPNILPGCDSGHLLQDKWETRDRANNFYNKQVLDFLAPKMQEFIKRQEFLFIASADRNGECDCTSKFGNPGFIRVLSDKYLIYPEYRGNGVFANTGNVLENPHVALLMIDFTRDTVGLHVNGKVKVVANDELLQFKDKLPEDVIEEIHQEGKKCPERWVMIEVEEAYIQCSKHIPLMKKLDKKIDWGTDNVVAKGGDYFELMNIPLYKRIGGDKVMEVVTDAFYRKVLQDELVGHFFEDIDMERQRLKQKSFLSMAFGGPYQYSALDLREGHKQLKEKYGLSDQHFNRVCEIFKETVSELNVPPDQIEEMMAILESTRDDVLNR